MGLSVRQILEKNDIESQDLDELVHDTASDRAAGLNNEGLDEQKTYLENNGSSVHENAEVLDEEVHDLMSDEAGKINNSGMSDQIKYLLDNGVTAQEILKSVGLESEADKL